MKYDSEVMDLGTFTVRLVEALAWPAVAVFVFWNIRDQIAALINRLRGIKWKGAEATFGEELDKVEGKLAPSPRIASAAMEVDRITAEAQLPPAYLVQQYWLRLEQGILRAAEKRGLLPPGRDSLGPLTKRILHNLELSDEDAKIIDDLRMLRNVATHSMEPNITMTDALRYRDLVENMTRNLEAKDPSHAHYHP